MALNNYTDIAEKLEEWLNRVGSSPVTTNAEDFIRLAQIRIQEQIRLSSMEKLVSLTITASQAAIPSDFLEVKEMVAFDGESAWDVYRATYTRVRNQRLRTDLTGPEFFDTVAGNFEFGPAPSSGVSVDLVYYQEFTFISPTNPTNLVSDDNPELILYAALIEASVFLKDFEQEKVYKGKYNGSLKRLEDQKKKAEWSGRLRSLKS